MSNSRSKREIVILDCCFSGAFAEGMTAKDEGFVDVRNQLGGEGRAILTSSTSTQLSFVEQGAETSTYTRYIVEGLETGVADRDEDGWISVDELHEYAKSRVQEVAPAMKPEIYAIREGFKILLAKAPSDDPHLIYRREVEYLISAGDGHISDAGRDVLDELQHKLGLTSEEAVAIEDKVLEPHREYQRKLKRYEDRFIKEIQREYPFSDNTREQLKRFQKVLGFTDENIALIEAPKITEQQLIPPPIDPPPPRNSNFIQYIGSCIIGVVIGGTIVYFFPHTLSQTCANKQQYSLNDRISLGEEILLKQDTNPDKEAGVKAFAQGDCLTAIRKFQAYRAANLSDPEALIYLNNAKALLQVNRIKIAVSVPIGTNSNVAKEILRGVAQVQNEVNSSNGINSKALEVAIANDDNDPNTASNIATEFVKDISILAVVGHNASNASIAAAPVYQNGGLVMMSATSFAPNLIGIGNYVFRTAPNISSIANKVSSYAINTAGKNNFLICVDNQAIDNLSFHEEFIKAISAAGAKKNPTICDVSALNFNPSRVISQAKDKSANGLLLGLYIDRIKEGLVVARANQGQLAVFSSSTLYTDETLKAGRALDGLVIAVPWHPTAFPNNPFASNAMELWKVPITWRTATSYDATLVIVKGLQQSNTREELQRTLHSPGFSLDGATGKIQFAQSGDRTNNAIFLVKVQQISGEYKFVPIPP